MMQAFQICEDLHDEISAVMQVDSPGCLQAVYYSTNVHYSRRPNPFALEVVNRRIYAHYEACFIANFFAEIFERLAPDWIV